jgi:hypothetical protein
MHRNGRIHYEKIKESFLMSLKALDIAVFMVLLSIVMVYVPPVAAPEWAASINTGPMSTLNNANTYSLNSLASSWRAFSGSSQSGISWTSIIDFALLSLRMMLEALVIAATCLVGSITVVFAIQAIFPMIPPVIFICIGAVMFIIIAWAWFQILSGRPGEVLT